MSTKVWENTIFIQHKWTKIANFLCMILIQKKKTRNKDKKNCKCILLYTWLLKIWSIVEQIIFRWNMLNKTTTSYNKIPLIIDTSLAPSPIASVTACLCFFISSTTNAFCRGVTRQQITDRHCETTSKNICSNWWFKQWTSECPFITIAKPALSSSGKSLSGESWEPPRYSNSVLELQKHQNI